MTAISKQKSIREERCIYCGAAKPNLDTIDRPDRLRAARVCRACATEQGIVTQESMVTEIVLAAVRLTRGA